MNNKRVNKRKSMNLINRIAIIILIIFFITNCAITPVNGTNQNLDDPNMQKVEIPAVKTTYKPQLNRFFKKDKPLMADSFVLDDMEVSKKKNGILLKFKYTGENPKANISTFFSGSRYFNITFFKGKFSKDIRQSFFNSSIIKNLQFFEFDESVQVTVRLKDDHQSTLIQTDDDYILISVFS